MARTVKYYRGHRSVVRALQWCSSERATVGLIPRQGWVKFSSSQSTLVKTPQYLSKRLAFV